MCSRVWLDQRMAIKLGKSTKIPGDELIQTGLVFCFLSAVIFLITAFNGVPNGLTIFGGGVLGLLMICAGYLKRIAAAVTAQASALAEAPDTIRH